MSNNNLENEEFSIETVDEIASTWRKFWTKIRAFLNMLIEIKEATKETKNTVESTAKKIDDIKIKTDEIEQMKIVINDIVPKVTAIENELIGAEEKKSLRSHILKGQENILSYLKEEVTSSKNAERSANAEKETCKAIIKSKETQIEGLKTQIKDSETQIKDSETQIKDSETQIEGLKTQIEDLIKDSETQIEEYEKQKATLENDVKSKNNKITEFESSFKTEKITNLLKAIIDCDALAEYRNNKIKDYSAQSYFHLIKFLGDPKAFVKSYYDYLVKFKKQHEGLVTVDEKSFYNAVNKYYDDNIIKGLDKLGPGKLDKDKHKAIDNKQPAGEYIGVVIPADINTSIIKIKSK